VCSESLVDIPSAHSSSVAYCNLASPIPCCTPRLTGARHAEREVRLNQSTTLPRRQLLQVIPLDTRCHNNELRVDPANTLEFPAPSLAPGFSPPRVELQSRELRFLTPELSPRAFRSRRASRSGLQQRCARLPSRVLPARAVATLGNTGRALLD
jgi:hypothetical protein